MPPKRGGGRFGAWRVVWAFQVIIVVDFLLNSVVESKVRIAITQRVEISIVSNISFWDNDMYVRQPFVASPVVA